MAELFSFSFCFNAEHYKYISPEAIQEINKQNHFYGDKTSPLAPQCHCTTVKNKPA